MRGSGNDPVRRSCVDKLRPARLGRGVSAAPRVSVLLPVRDGASTVARAVASIRAQTCGDWELIVVDDGSSDDTRGVVASLVREDRRVRVLTQDKCGLVAALNAGLAAARGDLIARMDADDEAHPERLAVQAAFLEAEANRDIGLASSLVEFGGDRGASAGYAGHVDWMNAIVTPEQIALNRFIESPLAHPSVMFRRELVARHGGYREGDFPEDFELWLRWLAAGVRMAKVPRLLLRWNDRPARLSRTDARYDPEAFFRLKAEWISRWLGDSETARDRAIYVWGAGRPTRKRAAHLAAHGIRLAGYIDVDVKKIGRGIGGTGLPVLGPATLPPREESFVLGYVSTWGAREDTRTKLSARGWVEGRDFLMCA